MFSAAGIEKHLHKFALTRYTWTSTTYTPYFTEIPPHVILIPEIESLKAPFEQQARDIVQETRNESNERNVGGYLHKSGCVLDKIKAANEYFLSKVQNFSEKSNSNYDGEVVIANDYFVFNNVIDQKKELEVDCDGGGGGITPSVSETGMVNETKGLNILWVNCREGSILLTQPSFSTPSMTFTNMLAM